MDYNKLAELIFPDITGTVDDLEARFPKRDLPEGDLRQAQPDICISVVYMLL